MVKKRKKKVAPKVEYPSPYRKLVSDRYWSDWMDGGPRYDVADAVLRTLVIGGGVLTPAEWKSLEDSARLGRWCRDMLSQALDRDRDALLEAVSDALPGKLSVEVSRESLKGVTHLRIVGSEKAAWSAMCKPGVRVRVDEAAIALASFLAENVDHMDGGVVIEVSDPSTGDVYDIDFDPHEDAYTTGSVKHPTNWRAVEGGWSRKKPEPGTIIGLGDPVPAFAAQEVA